MGRFGETIVKATAIGVGGVSILTGCTGGSGSEGGPSFAPTTGAAEATASPSPEATHIISPSPSEAPAPTVSPERAGEIGSLLMGTVANTEDASGNPIGVWVYTSPHVNETSGVVLAQGDRVAIECIEEDARASVDRNTAAEPIRWDDYYKLPGTRDLKTEYVPEPFIKVDGGRQAVPLC